MHLYVRTPLQRCNIGFDHNVRYYMNENWRKSCEGIEAYSASSGIYFRFVADRDLEIHSNKFVHARILVVVKEPDGTFEQILVLMTSKNEMIIAIPVNQPFEVANAQRYEQDTSLMLAVSGECNPAITVNVFPINGLARHHQIQYDRTTNPFRIPDELEIGAAVAAPTVASTSMTVAVYRAPTQSYGIAIHEEQNGDRCYECHVPALRANDHAQQCGSKWFVSLNRNVYVKSPTVRCVLKFKQSPWVLLNGGSTEQHVFLSNVRHTG